MGVIKCSPADDQFLNKRGKCRDCPNCDSGRGRNLTQAKLIRTTLDNTKCLPCEECPTGTFNNEHVLTTECRPCTEDKCSSYHRNVQIQCTPHSDYICGSCHPGYDDFFHDAKHACILKSTEPIVPYTSRVPLTYPITGVPGRAMQQSKAAIPAVDSSVLATAVIIGLLGSICLAVVAIVVFLWKRRRTCPNPSRSVEHGSCVPGNSSSTLTSTGSECSSLLQAYDAKVNLLETDGPEESSTVGKKLAIPCVRGEFASVSIQPSTVGGKPVVYQSNGPLILYNHFDGTCSCHDNQCGPGCRPSATVDTTLIERDDSFLTRIASNICHDPTPLFRDLKISDSEVYNLNDNRKRSPEKISQKEFIHSVLKRWVELQERGAVYGNLRKALCANGFHRINDSVLS